MDAGFSLAQASGTGTGTGYPGFETTDDAELAMSKSPATVGRPRCPWGEKLAGWQIRKIELFVDEHIEGSLRVRELGRQINLSPSRFSKRFKASFGRPPYDYVLSRRIVAAKSFLEDTAEPLCQIASACGLTDQAHFSKVFKRHTGLTPKQWRQRNATPSGRHAGPVKHVTEQSFLMT